MNLLKIPQKVLIAFTSLFLVLSSLSNNTKMEWLQIPFLILATIGFILRLNANKKSLKRNL